MLNMNYFNDPNLQMQMMQNYRNNMNIGMNMLMQNDMNNMNFPMGGFMNMNYKNMNNMNNLNKFQQKKNKKMEINFNKKKIKKWIILSEKIQMSPIMLKKL